MDFTSKRIGNGIDLCFKADFDRVGKFFKINKLKVRQDATPLTLFLFIWKKYANVQNRVDLVRRRAMRALTSKIGSSYSAPSVDLNPGDPVMVLISRPNHRLGNLLLITPLIEEISARFPKSRIDLFLKGNVSSDLFGEHPNVNKIIPLPRKPFKELGAYLQTWLLLRKTRYDLVINVDRASSSGTISTQFAKSRYRIFGENFRELTDPTIDQKHIAKKPVLAFRKFLSKEGISSKTAIPNLNLNLKAGELAAGKKIVEELVAQSEKKTICLFTFATGDKCYAKDWWENFHALLERNFRECNFLEVLPVENVSNLSFQIPSFYSRDVRELASVIANTSVFIGADSGVMHLASAVHTPTVGLFCITDVEKYGPYGEGSFSIDTNQMSQEDSIEKIREIIEHIPFSRSASFPREFAEVGD